MSDLVIGLWNLIGTIKFQKPTQSDPDVFHREGDPKLLQFSVPEIESGICQDRKDLFDLLGYALRIFGHSPEKAFHIDGIHLL